MQLKWLSVADLIARAGGDPWAINQSLQAGSPAQISSLAEAFHGAGRHTAEADHAFEQARKRFDAAWNHQNGDHPINDSAEVQRVIKSLGAQSEQLPKIGSDLENIAAALAEAQKAGAQRISTLEHALQGLDHIIDAAQHDLQYGHPDAKTQAFLKKLIDDATADAADDVRDALGDLESTRDGYSATLQSCLGNLRTDGYDPNILAPVDADTQVPPPNASPEDVNRWWTSLTPQQRQRFMAEHPDQIGNLNGVPILARNDANLTVMNQDLDRVRGIASRNGVSVDDVLRDPAKFGLSATDVTRYQNANETKLGLDHDAGDPLHPKPVYLFAYDPTAFGGKGRAAIAIGNPDTAKNTAVIVPGTSSSVKGGWLHDGHNDAINLFEQANAADPITRRRSSRGWATTPPTDSTTSSASPHRRWLAWAVRRWPKTSTVCGRRTSGRANMSPSWATRMVRPPSPTPSPCTTCTPTTPCYWAAPEPTWPAAPNNSTSTVDTSLWEMPPPIRSACSVISMARARSFSARTSSALTPAWVPTPRSTGSGRCASAPRSPAPMASIPMTTRTTTTGAAKPSMACPTSSPAMVTNYKPTA